MTMALAMLLIELDVIPDDFPWDDLEQGALVNDRSCGVTQIDDWQCEYEAWSLNDHEGQDTTVERATEIALQIVADLERIGKFRMADNDWHIMIPKDTFLKKRSR
jgi:hypothetical protein